MKNKLLISLMLLFTITAAFDVDDYLTPEEENATITNEYFSLNHTVHYIVNVGGEPTFLIKDDALLTAPDEIGSTLKAYYSAQYEINSTEITLMRTYIQNYNDSRNNGVDQYTGLEEYSCRQAIFLPLYPCTNETSCNTTARMMCAYLNNLGMGCNDYSSFVGPITEFSYASFGTDSALANISNRLDSLNMENAVDHISKIKSEIALLKTYRQQIENTMFRIPLSGESCYNCTGVCPKIDLAETYLSSMDTLATSLSNKIAPLANYSSTSQKIHSNTQDRINQLENANTRKEYEAVFLPLSEQAKVIKENALDALSLIQNVSLQAKLDNFLMIEYEIETKLSTYNFTGLNESIIEYNLTLNQLNSSIAPAMSFYEDVENTSVEAEAYLIIAESQVCEGAFDELEELQEEKDNLDSSFQDGLSAAQYEALQEDYEDIIEQEKALIASGGGIESSLYLLEGASDSALDNFASVLHTIKPLTYSERAEFSSYLPISYAVLMFLIFTSFCAFIIMVYYGIARKPMNSILLLSVFLILVLFIGIFSLLSFFSADKALNRLSQGSFLNLAKSSNEVLILINKDGTDAATILAMDACASKISAALQMHNISSLVYTLDDSMCTSNSSNTLQDCLDVIEAPFFILSVADSDSTTYSGLLLDEANVKGRVAYLDQCAVAEAIKLS
ncbi:hypothetical protein KJ780_02075 [Candidatus Micrarchaeota archaeon]|nr:hypothetical protein [Candidatus Micrarchaeota archaeon]